MDGGMQKENNQYKGIIMEAPEKIYLIRNFSSSTALNTTNDHHGKFLNEWYKSREKDADVEYIRKDAFIEKACEWLNSVNLYFYEIREGVFSETLVEDFRDYMEKEED